MHTIQSRSSNSSLRNGSFGSLSSSAPSLASLMEFLKLKSIGTSDELGQSDRSGAGVNEMFETPEIAQPHLMKKPRQANQAAASAGRAMLAKTPKSSSDGVLHYEAKTASAPRHRRQVSRSSRRRVQQEGPPRKNGSFQGRSRDSFILKLLRNTEGGGTAA